MKYWKNTKAVLKSSRGNSLLGFAYAKWMKPNGIINGGVTSMAMIFRKGDQCTDRLFDIWYYDPSAGFFCWLFLGKANFFKSIISSVFYNLFLLFLLYED